MSRTESKTADCIAALRGKLKSKTGISHNPSRHDKRLEKFSVSRADELRTFATVKKYAHKIVFYLVAYNLRQADKPSAAKRSSCKISKDNICVLT